MKTLHQLKNQSLFILCLLFVTIGYTQTLEENIDQLLEAKYKPNELGAVTLI